MMKQRLLRSVAALLAGLAVFVLSWGLIAAALGLALVGLPGGGGEEGEGAASWVGALDPAQALTGFAVVSGVLALVVTLTLVMAALLLRRIYRGFRRRRLETPWPTASTAGDQWPY